MGSTEEHQNLITETKLLCAKEFPNELRLFGRLSGLLYARRIYKGLISYIRMRSAIPGQCDVYGTYFLKTKGITIPIAVEAEFKTGKAVLNPDQKVWRDYCLTHGTLWFEVRDKHEFVKQLRETIQHIREAIENESRTNN